MLDIEKEINGIKESIAFHKAARLARGNKYIQQNTWVSKKEWDTRIKNHPAKLQYLIDTLCAK